MPETPLPAPLLQAYRSAHYRLNGCDWMLQVGHAQPALVPHYQRHAVRSATYLTACNPLGTPQSASVNAERMAQLRQALQRAGWSWLDGEGQDPLGQWPSEDSVLVWGMDADNARAWGHKWEQNAVVWCNSDCVPQLMVLR